MTAYRPAPRSLGPALGALTDELAPQTLLADVGLEGQFHDGLRVTSATTMRYVAMALSEVNLELFSSRPSSGISTRPSWPVMITARSRVFCSSRTLPGQR